MTKEEFAPEVKSTKIDERGRITIPMEFRKFFPEKTAVSWRFDGKTLTIHFEGTDRVEFLTLEFQQNQIADLRMEIKKLKFQLIQLRKMVFNELMNGPGQNKQ